MPRIALFLRRAASRHFCLPTFIHCRVHKTGLFDPFLSLPILSIPPLCRLSSPAFFFLPLPAPFHIRRLPRLACRRFEFAFSPTLSLSIILADFNYPAQLDEILFERTPPSPIFLWYFGQAIVSGTSEPKTAEIYGFDG